MNKVFRSKQSTSKTTQNVLALQIHKKVPVRYLEVIKQQEIVPVLILEVKMHKLRYG